MRDEGRGVPGNASAPPPASRIPRLALDLRFQGTTNSDREDLECVRQTCIAPFAI
jgi:hypothetical protein